ncbi:MAG: hypothetical protein A2X06_08995 [Bacteroidetes bacterium GWC2_40_22]|nr:MAG: hypothetical protein A2X06_08995 [Bacteroidetes bacterium GWC2_40_22]
MEYHKIQKDELMDKYLASFGFTVLRFENRFVFRDPEYLKSEIRNVLNKRNESTKKTNHPPRPGNELCKHQIINHPGHPSFKRRGNFFYSILQKTMLKLTPMPCGGKLL